MTFRTMILSSYQAYIAFEDPSDSRGVDERAAEDVERAERLLHFRFPVMLEASFAEFDFANRWCWERFGSAYGECFQSHSDYPACTVSELHCHNGQWTSRFLVKTEYNFGFCEWYFADESHQHAFLEHVSTFNWGEKYPVVSPIS